MASLCDDDYLQALLDVEVALAIAEAEAGAISASSVPDIQAAAIPGNFDCAGLIAAAAIDGKPQYRGLALLFGNECHAACRAG